jgi:hypothetical protein
MFIGSYTFVGDIDELKAGHAKMLETIGTDGIFMHVALVGDGQLTVLDACPSEEVFKEFSQGEFFKMLVDKCGLPMPTIVGMGEVHHYVFEQK